MHSPVLRHNKDVLSLQCSSSRKGIGNFNGHGNDLPYNIEFVKIGYHNWEGCARRISEDKCSSLVDKIGGKDLISGREEKIRKI